MNITEKYFVLIQHPTKSRLLVSEIARNVGFIGSILLDLVQSNNLTIENGELLTKSNSCYISQAHTSILEEIENYSKKRKVKVWISKLQRKARKLQKETLIVLQTEEVININHKRFLFFKYYNTQLIDTQIRENLINELRNIVFEDGIANAENIIILSLIDACKAHHIIAKDRGEIRLYKKKIKEITDTNLITNEVNKVIREMQAAIMGAIIAASVVASAGSN